MTPPAAHVRYKHHRFPKVRQGWQYVLRVSLTDTWQSKGAAKRARLPGVAQRQSRSWHNRCEPSHRPMRQRERRMQGL